MSLPDPKKGWRDALRRVWSEECSELGGLWWGLWAAAVVAPPYFAFLASMGPPTFLGALPWVALVCFPVWYLLWWRLYTRPRMPTVWEVAIGFSMVSLLPVVWAGQTLARWVREASQEVAEHDRKAGE